MGRLDGQARVGAYIATTGSGCAADPIEQVDRLIDLADRGLPNMLNPSGLFCFDVDTTTNTGRGESLRYSLITLLGLLRRAQSGQPVQVAIDDVLAAVEQQREALGVGDLSLRLWVHTRRQSAEAEAAVADLERRLDDSPVDELIGLDVGWWVTAAAVATAVGLPAEHLLTSGLEVLRSRRSRRSPLFRHQGSGWRATYPNFATQIYSLLALAELARHDLFDQAEPWATELADCLIELRRGDGGWPWLYDANRGAVVEPYEIYSVHQDAMAPMALLALAEATGQAHYVEAALDGVAWCFGHNELNQSLVDDEAAVVNRSIRRQGAGQRLNLYGNTLLAGLTGSARRLDVGPAEINRTCRPYHLGWILEAWSGRQELLRSVEGGQR